MRASGRRDAHSHESVYRRAPNDIRFNLVIHGVGHHECRAAAEELEGQGVVRYVRLRHPAMLRRLGTTFAKTYGISCAHVCLHLAGLADVGEQGEFEVNESVCSYQYFVLFCISAEWMPRRNGEKAISKRADDLRAVRLDKRLTQEEVAEKFKVSQGYYSSIERGQKPNEIAEALKVVNRMRTRTDRTDGGGHKAGRQK